MLVLGVFLLYLLYLNSLISHRFDGDTWAVPSRVYARPLTLSKGYPVDLDSLLYELNLSTYQAVDKKPEAGQYRQFGNSLELHSRAFEFSDRAEPAHYVRIDFSPRGIRQIRDLKTGTTIHHLRLPPIIIGSYHPDNNEDRSLLSAKDIPQLLIDTLIAVEDRQFYQHFGINPFAIGRALLANLRAGRTVQGGSTLTQQLAKNLFLTSKRSWLRKINEACMALLLEIRLSKRAILTAYVNEIFLLQQNNISVHGFAQASRMLFKQTVDHLSADQLATMVGMIKGPTRYNPIRYPMAARKRRNLVLGIMRDHGIINQAEYTELVLKPLGTVDQLPAVNPFPAYLDLVKRQLGKYYSSSELSAKGLRIFTAFDPLSQWHLQQGLQARLARLGQAELQAAVIIADYRNGDIKALVGDRNVDFPGFNRAILAQRQIGSLIKPILLYSLIESGHTLTTRIDDKPIRIRQSDGNIWEPRNYDQQLHGQVSLYEAFIKSYNLPFVNLGIHGGLENLAYNLEKIHLLKHPIIYPSLLLGTTAMSVFEVAQMYQVIANNGYFTPLTSIRLVTDTDNRVLNRLPANSVKLFDEAVMSQVQRALIGVVEAGTAQYLRQRFGRKVVAGKTGTTNDTRDSWFSGFTDQQLTVVWLGRDDNQPTYLSGSAGALRVWADIMHRNGFSSFNLQQ